MSNTFRKEYRNLTEDENEMLEDIKTQAEKLEAIYHTISAIKGPSREVSLAMTKLEESVMWVVKRVTQ